MASIINSGKFLARDGNGVPYAGAELHTFLAGSAGATPQATYTDSTLGTPNANPVILDADGRADVWIGDASYLFILTEAGGSIGSPVWSVDNYTAALVASEISIIDVDEMYAGSNIEAVLAEVNSSVDTIADLRAIDPTAVANDKKTILVRGYATAGDTGGGEFYWNSTSTTTDNGGTVIQATAIVTGRWERVHTGSLNVKWFGAVGDGVTDDTDAFNNSFAETTSIDPVLVPAASYAITGTVTGFFYSTGKTTIVGGQVIAIISKGGEDSQTNTLYGHLALEDNTVTGTAEEGEKNTAFGTEVLRTNTIGYANAAMGYQALSTNLSGFGNSAFGSRTMLNTSTGNSNSAFGNDALQGNTTGTSNTAIGKNALSTNVSADFNTAVGHASLNLNNTGASNTAVGFQALTTNVTGSDNAALGRDSLLLATGSQNTAAGSGCLFNTTTGGNSAAVGFQAAYLSTTGSDNAALGLQALYSNTSGSYNVAVGRTSMFNCTTGSGNVQVGGMNSAGSLASVFNITTENDRVVMGSSGVTNAYIQVAWTIVSDKRDKTNFAEVPHGIEFVKRLKPTAYQFRENRESDTAVGPVRYGFKAQDVLELEGENPVIVDASDDEKLRFNDSNLMAVMVKAIQDQQEIIESLEARISQLEVK